MKRILGFALVASLFALVPQQASAWSNVKFGAGVNFQWQTANNAIGHHFWRNGQIPTRHSGRGFHYQPYTRPYYGPAMPHYPTSAGGYAPASFGGYQSAPISYGPQFGYPQAAPFYGQSYVAFGQ